MPPRPRIRRRPRARRAGDGPRRAGRWRYRWERQGNRRRPRHHTERRGSWCQLGTTKPITSHSRGTPTTQRDAVEDWIDRNQLGRRNLTADAFKLLLGRVYNRRKQAHGGQLPKGKDQNDPSLSTAAKTPPSTAAIMASEFGVGEATVKRAGKFAAHVAKSPATFAQLAHKSWVAISLSCCPKCPRVPTAHPLRGGDGRAPPSGCISCPR